MKTISKIANALSGSYVELNSKILYLNRDRVLALHVVVNFSTSENVIENQHPELYRVKLTHNSQDVVLNETLEVNTTLGGKYEYSVDVPMNNLQKEAHLFKLELLGDNQSKYTYIEDLETIEPLKQSKIKIELIHDRTGKVHKLTYSTNSTMPVYLKQNNDNWKKLEDSFTIREDGLQGKINYFQAYTLDDENQRVYSNVIRIVKDD